MSFDKSFPKTIVKTWDKEDGNYEANFNQSGKIMSATFNTQGKWMETELTIKVSELPEAIPDFIKKNMVR